MYMIPRIIIYKIGKGKPRRRRVCRVTVGYGDTLLNPHFVQMAIALPVPEFRFVAPHRSFRRCRRLGSAVLLDRLTALSPAAIQGRENEAQSRR